jgi:uncharacterized LabA/DUF88 family protein
VCADVPEQARHNLGEGRGMSNRAFIDGQNLYLGTTRAKESWVVDLSRLRVYLLEKYNVEKAYYFLGYANDDFADMYTQIQEAGFVLVFREHNAAMIGKKKGNVDTDIVFAVMRMLYKNDGMDKAVLVSGDGDYWRMVNFLIEEKRFAKILFPNRNNASSLYRKLAPEYKVSLDIPDIKKKIANKNAGPS